MALLGEVSINAIPFQISPNTWRLVCTTSTGQFVGDLVICAPSPDAWGALLKSFSQLAQQQANRLVRASVSPTITS